MHELLAVAFLYFLFIWLPVDWIVTAELNDLENSYQHWLRRAILKTLRVRILNKGNNKFAVQAKAMWITPWRTLYATDHLGHADDFYMGTIYTVSLFLNYKIGRK